MVYRDKILMEFDKNFSLATPTIRDERRLIISNKFDLIIGRATETSLAISKRELEMIYTKTNIKIRKDIIIDPRDSFDKWYSINIKTIHDEFNSYINQTLWMDSIKEEYIDKIKDYVKNNVKKARIIFNKWINFYDNFILTNFVALEEFIELNNIMTYVSNIKNSFSLAINIIIKKFNEYKEIKWSYDTSRIQVFPIVQVLDKINILLEKDVNYLMIQAIPDINFINIEIKNDLLQVRNSGTYDHINDIISDYLILKYEEQFINERNIILSQKLIELQSDLLIQTTDIISLKKYHNNINTLYTEIINGENKVEYLNIFDHLVNYINYYSQCNTSSSGMKFIENSVLVKYTFILSRIPLCRIYVKSEFDEVYSDILPYYNLIEKDKILLNFELVKVIIDKLFIKCIENK